MLLGDNQIKLMLLGDNQVKAPSLIVCSTFKFFVSKISNTNGVKSRQRNFINWHSNVVSDKRTANTERWRFSARWLPTSHWSREEGEDPKHPKRWCGGMHIGITN